MNAEVAPHQNNLGILKQSTKPWIGLTSLAHDTMTGKRPRAKLSKEGTALLEGKEDFALSTHSVLCLFTEYFKSHPDNMRPTTMTQKSLLERVQVGLYVS